MPTDWSIRLGSREISARAPCYIIAEIGVNHNGDSELGHRLIDEAKAAGADAVKFQTFRSADLVLATATKADYQIGTTGEGSQADMLRALELPFDVFVEFQRHCASAGIDFISTAFDPESLEFVISLEPVCLKWASGELTNLPLLAQARRSTLPILLSTGMASLAEIGMAVDCIGPDAEVVILQCVSNYPARVEDQNLRVLPALSAVFGCPVGFSDHTVGPFAALVARALGMAVLEKHFTLDRNMVGPDHAASVEPAEFREMTRLLRQVEAGLGDGIKRPVAAEANVRSVARKSLVFRHDLPAGHVIAEADLTAKRPGAGIPPNELRFFLGRRLCCDVRRDELLELPHVG